MVKAGSIPAPLQCHKAENDLKIQIMLFETLDQLKQAETGQLTAQQLLNGRAHVNGQWQNIEVSDELRTVVIDAIVTMVGGRGDTPNTVRYRLKRERPQHWALGRIFIEKDGDKPAQLYYCAGQEQAYEMKCLRDYLRR